MQPNGLVAVTYNATSAAQNISIYSNIKCNHLAAFNSAQLEYIHPVAIDNDGPNNGNGDYSATVEDPVVPGRFWLHHCLGPSLSGANFGPGSIVKRFEGCGADFTGDGLANAADVAAFGSLFELEAPETDFIPDEITNGDDLLEYLEVGLP